jgi:AraC-like DNA-binding protein
VIAPKSSTPVQGVDRLTGLLRQFAVGAALLDADTVLRFPRRYGLGGAAPGAGHLHVLWSGTVDVIAGAPGSAPIATTRVSGPTILLHASGAPHQLIPIERAAVSCAALDFVHGAAHPLVRALPPELAIPVDAIQGLDATLSVLESEVEQVRCGQPLIASRLLEVVLLQVLRWVFAHPELAAIPDGLVRGMTDPAIAASLVAMHDDPGHRWTLDRLAAAATLSRSAFAERFHRLVGATPAHYLASYRMAIAQGRLLRGAHVAEIAPELGYANGSGLSRAFLTHVGCSPTAWLAQAKR